ncbi:MAG: TadE/TadG family type IV pilus assembly protein [Candidatus Brocadiia bacterium]
MQWGSRKGQVVLLAPAMALVSAGILMLAVDVGRIVNTRARLQNVADSACLAAAQVLSREHIAGTEEDEARSLAVSEAETFRDANWTDAGIEIEFGTVDADGDFSPVGTDTPASAVRVSSYRNSDAPGGDLDLFFAPLAGLNGCQVAAASKAHVATTIWGVLRGLRPFAIPEDQIPGIGEEMIFYPADADSYDGGLGEDTVAPGCWGLLNLDGGSLGSDELKEWIESGYDMPFLIDPDDGFVHVDGCSGFRATLNQPIKEQIGNSFMMVVYDEVSGTGANTEFRCIGFLKATITDCKLVGNDPYVSCRVDEMEALHDIIAGFGGMYNSPNLRKVQLLW